MQTLGEAASCVTKPTSTIDKSVQAFVLCRAMGTLSESAPFFSKAVCPLGNIA
eukprot:CAMPEP_0179184906 /NCGR_PEP_ID=MMETSP0796-20121207/91683_1 /TAXON_ID=73915 /ORGANISM="Pyrodinium bahamense, Strain pbaha01" /LENGTH=52 /DNA_ID=CAMNT_0020888855 /DNA_START=64 /DNA_END=222 /DNA_ORIENTATION=+